MRKIVLCIILVLCFITTPPVFAYTDLPSDPQTWCEFENFFEIIAAMEAEGLYAHYLAENSQRYENYHAQYPDVSFDRVIAFVNVNVDKGAYTDIQPVANPDSITLLINKNFCLSSEDVPGDLVYINETCKAREEMALHYKEMRNEMETDGLRLYAIAGYRSYNKQRSIFDRGVDRFGSAFIADQQYARPGHSEHQAGLSIDVLQTTVFETMWEAGFETTDQFSWLMKNAHNYGFIFRYPRGYEIYTGYNFEPWHWRYVGVDVATRMRNMGIVTYEEYYGRFLIPGVLENVREYMLEQQELSLKAAGEAKDVTGESIEIESNETGRAEVGRSGRTRASWLLGASDKSPSGSDDCYKLEQRKLHI